MYARYKNTIQYNNNYVVISSQRNVSWSPLVDRKHIRIFYTGNALHILDQSTTKLSSTICCKKMFSLGDSSKIGFCYCVQPRCHHLHSIHTWIDGRADRVQWNCRRSILAIVVAMTIQARRHAWVMVFCPHSMSDSFLSISSKILFFVHISTEHLFPVFERISFASRHRVMYLGLCKNCLQLANQRKRSKKTTSRRLSLLYYLHPALVYQIVLTNCAVFCPSMAKQFSSQLNIYSVNQVKWSMCGCVCTFWAC